MRNRQADVRAFNAEQAAAVAKVSYDLYAIRTRVTRITVTALSDAGAEDTAKFVELVDYLKAAQQVCDGLTAKYRETERKGGR